MKHILYKISFNVKQLFYIVDNIERILSAKHIYLIFNSIYIAMLGVSAIVITIKKEKIFGLSFDDYYNYINGKKCDNRLIGLFSALITMPVLNYIVIENFVNNFVYECILMSVEMVCLYEVIRPIYLCITANEIFLKKNFYKRIGLNKYTNTSNHEISISIITYLIIKSDFAIDEVVKKVSNNEKEMDIIYELVFIAMYRYLDRAKNLTNIQIKTISKYILVKRKKEQIKYYVHNIKHISKILFEICKRDKNNILAEILSANYLIIRNEDFLIYYQWYYMPLLISAIVNSLNNDSIEMLQMIRLSILKSFQTSYPIELINIIDSILYCYIELDEMIPDKLKKELNLFLIDKRDDKTWDNIKTECRYREIEDFDNYLIAYGIKEYDLTYEPKISKVVRCYNDSRFRSEYYLIILLYSNSLAINFIKNILKKNNKKTYYSGFINALNYIITGNSENVKSVLKFNNIKEDKSLYNYNVDGIKNELAEINKIEIMNKDEIYDTDIKTLHDRIEKELYDKLEKLIINSNDNKEYNIMKLFSICTIVESDALEYDNSFIFCNAVDVISSSINKILVKNQKKINIIDFINEYKKTDVKYIDPYLASKFDEKFSENKTKLNLDVLFGNYIILNDFTMKVLIDKVEILKLIDDELDEYINSFKAENGLCNYVGKIYSFDSLKEYFSKKNHVYSIRINYIIKYNEEDLNKVLYIDVD